MLFFDRPEVSRAAARPELLEPRIALDVSFPALLEPLGPSGGLIYRGIHSDAIDAAGERDGFNLELDAGQTLTLLVTPAAGLQPSITIEGPGVNVSASAPGPGGKALIQTAPIAVAGTYTVGVTGSAGAGSYNLEVVLNSALESEAHGGPANDIPATAQVLDPAFISLGSGASRGAVVGAGSPGEDWYRFSATGGEAFTVVGQSLGGVAPTLEIHDAGGTLLVKGIPTGSNAQSVRSFVAPVTGDYFARVTGATGGTYAVVVTRGAEFNLERNDSIATAQPIGSEGLALGAVDQRFLGRLFGMDGGSNQIREIDPLTGAVLRSFPAPFTVTSSFSDAGLATTATSLLVAGPSASAIYELNPDTGATVRTIPNPGVVIEGMAFLRDEIFLLSDTPSAQLKVLDYATGAVKRTLPRPSVDARLAASETALYGTSFSTIYQIDPLTGTTTNVGTTPLASSVPGLGIIGNEIFGADATSIRVNTLTPLAAARTLANLPTFAALGADGGANDADFYRVTAASGATLTINTATPAGGPGEFVNRADPQITLFDPSGALVASDDNSATDGRNALLNFVAPATGVYTIEVRTAPTTRGEYILNVEGGTSGEPPFVVTQTSPVNGARLATRPLTVQLDFSDAMALPSVEAADLTIDGTPATAVTAIDGDTLEFTIADPGPGTHAVAIAAGALSDVQGSAIAAYAGSFTVDVIAPRIVSSSLQQGDLLASGALTVTVGFSEPMNVTNLSIDDVTLVGALRGASYASTTRSFDATGTELTLTYSGLPDDNYLLTFRSADGAFEDVVGRNLDGEPVTFPLPPNQSGDGIEGGNFAVGFALDAEIAALGPFAPARPLGSLVHEHKFTPAITASGDADRYAVALEAGSTFAAFADPGATLQPKLTLLDAANSAVATSAAPSPGEDTLLQAMSIASAGTYTLVVEGVAGTSGLAAMRVALNAFLEPESSTVANNNTRETAVNVDPLFGPLPGGGSRSAVLGSIERVSGALPMEIEPNNSTAQANAAIGNFGAFSSDLYQLAVRGNRSASTDIDYFNIGTLEAGDVITISQAAGGAVRGTLSDGFFTLYRNGSSVSLISDDDSGAGADAFRFRYTVSTTDTYAVAASGFGGSTGSYELAVWLENSGSTPQTGASVTVETESNDTFATANDLSTTWRRVQYLSRTSASILPSRTDDDYLQFEFNAGDLVTVNLDSAGTADLGAALLNSSGAVVAQEDGSSVGPGANSPIYAFRIPTSGTYYVRATSDFTTGAYTADVYLSADTPPPVPQTAEDFYSLTLAAGDRATFAADASTGLVRFELQDAGGAVLAANIGGGAANARAVLPQFTAAVAGTYYIRITGDANASYNFVAVRGAAFDVENNSTFAGAQPLAPDDTVLGYSGNQQLNRLFVYDSVANLIRELNPTSGAVLKSFAPPAPEVPSTGEYGLATTGTSLLAAGASNSPVYEIDPDTGATIRTIGSPGSDVIGMAFLNDEIFVRTSSTIRVLDYVTGALKRTISPSFNPPVTGLAAGGGLLLGTASSGGRLYEINPQNGQTTELGVLPGLFSSTFGLGVIGKELFIAENSFIRVFNYPSLTAARTLGSSAGARAIGGDTSPTGDSDYYRIQSAAGASLVFTTATPGDAPGEPRNTFDPTLELYDATGALVGRDDNGGADGRNALLAYQTPAAGEYVVRVRGTLDSIGEYVLHVTGAENVAQPFLVTTTTPANGAPLVTVPTTMRLNFNHALLLPSLQAGDLMVDGAPAGGFTLIDGDTVEFALPGGLAEGAHNATIAAGALTDVLGQPLGAFASSFRIDLTAPRVISTNVQQGDILPAGAFTAVIGFDEPMKVETINTFDLTLAGAVGGRTYTAESATFNPEGTVLTATYSPLPEDNYTLTLTSSTNAFEDAAGRDLDGEATTFPIPPNRSGNGVDGGNFAVSFLVDAAAQTLPMAPLRPHGSGAYEGVTDAVLHLANDVDSFTLRLETGQSLSLLAQPAAALRPTLILLDPAGNQIAANTAASTGGAASIDVGSVPATGEYTIHLSSDGAALGRVSLQARVNVTPEAEQRGGPANDTAATAESLTFFGLPGGSAGARVVGLVDRNGVLPAEFEPNDTIGSANPGAANFTGAPSNFYQLAIRGIVTPSTDIDYLKIGTLEAGDILTISQSGVGSSRGTLDDPFFTLYRGSPENPIFVAAESSGGSRGDALLFRRSITATDTYFIAASTSFSTSGTYDLAAFLENSGQPPQTQGAVTVETENNNTAATATDVSASWRAVQYLSRTAGSLTGTDTDWFSFEFSAGDLATVYLDVPTFVDFRMALLNDAGNVLAQDDASGFAAGGDSTVYAFRIPAAGRYFLRVQPEAPLDSGSYNADIYLSSSVPPPAVGITDDFYSAALSAGSRLSFMLGSVSGPAPQIELRDSVGAVLALGSDAGPNYAAIIRDFTVPAAGNYFVRVSGAAGAEYQLLALNGADFDLDGNDAFADAQPLGVANSIAGYAGYAALDRLFVHDSTANAIKEIDRQTGSVLRGFPAPVSEDGADFGLATTGRTLLAAGGTNELLYELDPDTGLILRTLPTPDDFTSGLAFANNEIFVLTDSPAGTMFVLDYASGALKRTFIATGVSEGLATADGMLLGIGTSGRLFRIDEQTGATTRLGTLSETPAGTGLGVVGTELFVSTFSDIRVYRFPSLLPLRTLNGFDNLEAIGADAGGGREEDYFQIPVAAGGTLTLSTATPNGTLNRLDPILELFDAAGVLLASDDNGAGDGRNASLSFIAPAAATYFVRVSAAGSSRGEYVLNVSGHDRVPAPFLVLATNPPAGGKVAASPASVRVDFDRNVALGSLAAGDLTIDGVAATAFTVVDGDSVEFALPAGLAAGVHTVALAAGVVIDLSGTPLTAYEAQFEIDVVPPRIVGVSIQEGGLAASGTLSYVIDFNEPMRSTGLDAADFVLRGIGNNVQYNPAQFSYNASGTALTLTWNNLPDELFALTLRSGDGQFEDAVGLNLDGEAAGFPIPPNITGDGVEGGDFVVNFTLDAAAPVALAPLPVAPTASLIARSSRQTTISSATDEDVFTIAMAAGETLGVTLNPSATLQPALVVLDPSGAIVGEVAAGAADHDIALLAFRAQTTGLYTISLSGVAGSTGGAFLSATINATVEAEHYHGMANDTPATAQDLSAAFATLDVGKRRAGVLGSSGGDDWFKLDLAAGETLAVALDDTRSFGTIVPGHLTLTDIEGTVLVEGTPGIFFERAIHNFIAPTSGSYLLHVTNPTSAQTYTLMASVNAEIDRERNDSVATAQDLGETPGVVGALEHGAANRVFVFDRSSGSLSVLNATTGAEVNRFFSLFPAGGGSDYGLATTANTVLFGGPASSAILEFDPRTGSVLRQIPNPSLFISGLAFLNDEIFALTDTPAGRITVLDYATGAVKRIFDVDRPLTENLAASSTDLLGVIGNTLYRIDPFAGSTTTVGVLNGVGRAEGLAVVGNQLFVGDQNFVRVFDLATRALIRVVGAVSDMEAVGGDAGARPDEDFYEIHVAAAGTGVSLSTTTPGIGNSLDPRLELRDPAGTIVASDDNSGSDGRNATLTYTAATAGTFTVRVTAAGGEGAYFLRVLGADSVNNAPTLDVSDDLALATIFEDQIDHPGARVADLLGLGTADPRIADLDANASAGVAIVGADVTHGTWEYSLDGTTWLPLGTPGISDARLLVPEALVRFVPAADFSGSIAAGLSFRAWDQTAGTNGGTADTMVNGGTSAFSTAIESAAVAVTPVNDAPGVDAPLIVQAREGALAIFSTAGGNAISVRDIDAGVNPVQVTLSATEGVLTLAGTAGLTFTTGDGIDDALLVFTGELSAINSALDGLTFTPAEGFVGRAGISIGVDDLGNSGGGALTAAATVEVRINPVITFTDRTTFTDASGDLVKVALKGGGRGEIWLADAEPSNAAMIVLDGTTAKSTLRITTARGTETTLGGVLINGPLKSFTAPTSDLVGDFSIAGTLRKAVLDDVNAAIIQLRTDPTQPLKPRDAAKLTFDRLTDVSLTSRGLPIAKLAASEWINADGIADTILASNIGTLRIDGKRKENVPGNFEAALELAGTLGALNVRGLMENAIVKAAGNIGRITLGGMSGSRVFAGVADGVTTLPDESSDFSSAARIDKVKITGGGGSLPFTGSSIAAAALGRVSIRGLLAGNGGEQFGVAADTIAALTVRHGAGTETLRDLDAPAVPIEIGDFVVRVV